MPKISRGKFLSWRVPAVVRFWRQVNKDGPVHPIHGRCWEWTGALVGNQGYGSLVVNNRPRKAHRFSYDLHKHPIAKGLLVCHKCDNPKCVNPDHLFLGTDKDNSQDMLTKGRGNKAKGSANGMAKLTEAEVKVIKTRYQPRSPVNGARQLGREYGVSHEAISYIVRLGWKHIKGIPWDALESAE